ncbi:MAG: NosD domain-containing protein [Methanobacteriota archaeon]
MRKLLVILLAALFFVPGTFQAGTALAPTPPTPAAPGPGTIYIYEDWIVYGYQNYTNKTIILRGNLSVAGGATLDLRNSTLRFDCRKDLEFAGEVKSGGKFMMGDLDGDPATANDSGGLTSHDGLHRYSFYARAGSVANVTNSKVSLCGAAKSAMGFAIQTSTALMLNTTFSSCFAGLSIASSSPTVESCTFQSAQYGIDAHQSSAQIRNCTVVSSSNWAVRAQFANLQISGMSILGGYGGIYLSYSNPEIGGLQISGIAGTAVYCWEASPLIYDSSIVGGVDVQADWNSFPGLVNTTFSSSRTIVGNGQHISVGRYSPVSVFNESGYPADGAKVSLIDSEGLASWSGRASEDGTAVAIERIQLVTSGGVSNRSGGTAYAYVDYGGWTEAGSSPLNGSAVVATSVSLEIEYFNQAINITDSVALANATYILSRELDVSEFGNLSLDNVTLLFDASEEANAGLHTYAGGSVRAEGCRILSVWSPRPLQSAGYALLFASGSSASIRNSSIVSSNGASVKTGDFDAAGTSFLHAKADALTFEGASCSPGAFSVFLSKSGVAAYGTELTLADCRFDNLAGNGFSAYGSVVETYNLTVRNASYGVFASDSSYLDEHSLFADCDNGLASSSCDVALLGTRTGGCDGIGMDFQGGKVRLEACTIVGNNVGIADGSANLWAEGCELVGNAIGLSSSSAAPVLANSTLSNTWDAVPARGSRPALLNCVFSEEKLLVPESSYVNVGGFARFNVTESGLPAAGALVSLGAGFYSATSGTNGSTGWMAYCDHRVTATGYESPQPVKVTAILAEANASRLASVDLALSQGFNYALELPDSDNCLVWGADREVWGDERHANETIVVKGDVKVMEGGNLDIESCDLLLWSTPQVSYGLWAYMGDITLEGCRAAPTQSRSPGRPLSVPVTVSPGANLTVSGSELAWVPVNVYGRADISRTDVHESFSAGIYSVSGEVTLANSNISYCRDGIEAYDSRITMENASADNCADSGTLASNCALEISGAKARANLYGLSINDGSRGNITGADISGNSDGCWIKESDVAVAESLFTGNTGSGLYLANCGAVVRGVEARGNQVGVRLDDSAPMIQNLTAVSNYYGLYSYNSAPHLTGGSFDGNQYGIYSNGMYVRSVKSFSNGLEDAMESFIGGGSRAKNSVTLPERARILGASMAVTGVDLKKSAMTSDSALQFSPAVWGDTVAYADKRGGVWAIRAYNLTADTDGDGIFNYMEYPHLDPDPAVTVITDGATLDYDPAIWGTTIVWTRWDAAAGYDIMAHDLSNGTTWPAVPGASMDLQPSIWGDRLAWSAIDGKQKIFAGNLSGGAEQLSNNSRYNINPDIHGDEVVWHDYEGNPYYELADIHLYNLTTGEDKLVQALPSQQCLPTLWGDWLAYQDDRKGDTNLDGWKEWDIYLYNLSTEEERRLTFDGQASFAPDLSGDKVVWYWHDRTLDDSLPATIEGWSVMMHNITTGTTETLERETGGDSWPVANGPRVAWVNKSGGGDIWVYDQRYAGFPTNPWVDIGDDGSAEWARAGEFTSTVRMNGTVLAKAFAGFVRNSESDAETTVPIRIGSSSTGRVRLSGLELTYEVPGLAERTTFTGDGAAGVYCWDSDFRLVNATLALPGTEINAAGGSNPELLNCTFDGDFAFSDARSNVTVRNFLHVLAEDKEGSPLAGARVRAYDSGTLALDSLTSEDGRLDWSRVTDRMHNSTGAWENETLARVDYLGAKFDLNPRLVPMAESHLEIFSTDRTPPTFLEASPAPDSFVNAPYPTISILAIDPYGIDASSIKLYVDGYRVYYNLSAVTDGYNVSYFYEVGANDGQVIRCRIAATDMYGNFADFYWNFTADLSAPVILWTDPFDGEARVGVFSNITVRFNEPVRKVGAEMALWFDPPVSGEFYWADGATMVFVPGEQLLPSRAYAAHIEAGIEDVAGNSMGAYGWNFITESDIYPPSASREWPAPGEGYTDLSPVISVQVTDVSGVVQSSIRLYVQGYAVFYDLAPVSGGYNVSYWHAAGFSVGDVVRCRIVARDPAGNLMDRSWSFTAVTFVDIPLDKGWNLVSLPLVQLNESVESALSSIKGKWDHVMAWDPGNPWNRWKQYFTGWSASMNDLTKLDHRVGFWLRVSDACTLRVCGLPPGSTTIELRAGWNLVGYPSANDSFYSTVEFRTDTGATILEGFDPAAEYLVTTLAYGLILKRCTAYWVYVPADAVWTVDW